MPVAGNFAGDRLGIIVGSIASALIGFFILKFTLPPHSLISSAIEDANEAQSESEGSLN